MSKTIEDYRQIVKVLKLQLLKIRQENNSLSKTLGIATETQTSSFTPRVEKFRTSQKDFAKHLYLFNLFAHKCEIIGVTPQMVFRIADKKRDKKVSTGSLAEIMKRLKLKLDDVEINKLLSIISKSSSVFYEEYLQYMSAFQINAEQYPPKNQRNYAQLCMLKFGHDSKEKNIRPQKLYSEATDGQDGPYMSFESFRDFCRKNTNLKDVQVVAVFIALDTNSDCQIDKEVFNREMKKIFNLVDRGVSHEIDERNNKGGAISKVSVNEPSSESDNDVKLEEQTGVEAAVKKKTGKKELPKQKQKVPLKGDSGKMLNEMKKAGVRVNELISKLLEKQEARKLVKPFSLMDFSQAIQAISKKVDKKKIIFFFKCLDSSGNGSASTDQLLKLWLESSEMAGSSMMYKLLYRHMREIQCPQPITRFQTRGFSPSDTITLKMLQNVLQSLKLPMDYLKLVESQIPQKCKVSQFVEFLKGGGVSAPGRKFKQMNTNQYENMNVAIKKLVPKQAKNFSKYVRLENQLADEMNKGYWDTIFTDEWSCWNYCLETAKNLTSFWRDHEFGPSKGDPHGYRSIVGNESEVPPGLPFEDEIVWMTFEEMLAKQENPAKVKLFSENLSANDIIQGRLGDCWFVSSLSIVASKDEYIKGKPLQQCATNPENLVYGVHPVLFHGFEAYGLYVFKFFKGFKPIYIVVDDLFPVEQSSSELIFAKSPDAGLQWVAFLEKAYSKLHHCYSNMISGDISQGLCDLTNRLPIKEDMLDERSEDIEKERKELRDKLFRLNEERQLMGCSISAPKGAGVEQPVQLDGERCGLFYGHAYSIGDVLNLKTKDKQQFDLMRVRNPWGHGEWMLDWSDQPADNDPDYAKLDTYLKDIEEYYSRRFESEKKLRLRKEGEANQVEMYKRDKNDGEFLMNLEDFTKLFSNLFTGFELSKKYTCSTIKEKWDEKTPSGICKAKGASEKDQMKFARDNHQYIMDISTPTDILIMLIQQDGRLFRGEKYPYKTVCNGINILVFTLDEGERLLEKFDMEKMTLRKLKFELRREVNYWHRFEPGRYAIIPCKLKNNLTDSEFEMRVYSESQISLKKARGPSNNFTPLREDTTRNVNQGGITSMLEILKK